MVDSAKIASVVIIFGLSVLSGILSLVALKCLVRKLADSSKLKRAISLLNCLSGGVFFATSVLHLLPEAREGMEDALKDYQIDSEYPLTELALCFGFFFVLFLEHCAHASCAGHTHKEHTNGSVSQRSHSSPLDHSNNVVTTSPITVSYQKLKNELNEDPIRVADFEDPSYADDITYKTYGTVDECLDQTSVRPYNAIVGNSTPVPKENIFQESDRVFIRNGTVTKENIIMKQPSKNESVKFVSENDPDLSRSKLRGLVLLIALSLHMIFDGLAVGLLKSENKVWQLLAALSLHKFLVFFTIGVQTFEILASVKKTVFVIICFALVSPLGLLIGESIHSGGDSETRDLLSAILQGIATGTFLYVTFFEILLRELGTNDHDLLKVLSSVIGFVLVACVRLLENEEH